MERYCTKWSNTQLLLKILSRTPDESEWIRATLRLKKMVGETKKRRDVSSSESLPLSDDEDHEEAIEDQDTFDFADGWSEQESLSLEMGPAGKWRPA